MQYGYFDDSAREYVITNPDTPAPWTNYLGSPAYGAIITVNAGGYSFVQSGAMGRILRYSFNQFDEPGRYMYLRDNETCDFWSASWKPVAKPLSQYKTECRFGTGYAAFNSQYEEISSSALYYVPLHETYEIWCLTIENKSARMRDLSAFGYCEFTNDSNYEQDLVNLQYTQFISRTEYKNNCIFQHINEYTSQPDHRFFGLAGQKAESSTGRREAFLGKFRFQSPQALIDGKCDNSQCYNGNPCGALQARIILQPGEQKTMVFLLGNKAEKEACEICNRYMENPKNTVLKELVDIQYYWHQKLSRFYVQTPDQNFNTMVNNWNAFQCFITVIWSRAASLSYCGQRNGYGYRDTVQDIQGIIHLDPQLAKERLIFMLSAQVHHGAGLPLVKYTHRPGHEDTPEQESYVKATGHPHYRADDALWLFPTIYKYIAETGESEFLNEVIPYADHDHGTVLDHLKRAISFSLNHLGAHGMPAGLHADWNDCLRLGEQGESVFVAFQLYYAMKILIMLAADDNGYIQYLKEEQDKLYSIISECCVENDRIIRGFTEHGEIIGSKENEEASLWLNPQSWAVISGFASEEQGKSYMETVYSQLNTPYGLRILSPPYRNHAFDGARMVLFNPGTKENGSIFCQTQGWAILAEALLGHGNRAFLYYSESSPASFNQDADKRMIEPYAHGQFIESIESPYAGRSHVHWLTGTASTVMVGCVEGILGLRPTPQGLLISPSVPSVWEEFTIKNTYRNCLLHISVFNKDHKESGVKKLVINGKEFPYGIIRDDFLTPETKIDIYL